MKEARLRQDLVNMSSVLKGGKAKSPDLIKL
jgi:hypothetical protein